MFTDIQEGQLSTWGCPSTAMRPSEADDEGKGEHIPCRQPHEVLEWLKGQADVKFVLLCTGETPARPWEAVLGFWDGLIVPHRWWGQDPFDAVFGLACMALDGQDRTTIQGGHTL